MRRAWVLLLMGCAAPQVTYEVRAPCPDPAAALIKLREKHGVQTFSRWDHYHCWQKFILTFPEPGLPITTHDDVEAMLTPSASGSTEAMVTVGGRTYTFSEGRVFVRSEADADEFVHEAGAVLVEIGAAPREWAIEISPISSERRQRWVDAARPGPVSGSYGGGIFRIGTEHEPEFIRLAHLWGRR